MSFRSIAVLSATLFVAAALSACGGATARYERYMERGKSYLEAGDFDKAKIEFKNAMQIAPKSAEARFEAGVAAERALDLRAALGLYQAAIDMRPDYPEARANLARIFVMGAAPDRGLTIIADGLAKHPDNVALLVVRALAKLQLKKPGEARVDAERAAQLDPADEGAAALRASLLRAENDPAQAIEVVEKTLKLNPGSIDLRRILANLQIERGDFAAAEIQLREVVKRDPKQLALRYELANFYVRWRKIDQAQKALEGAVEAAPRDDAAKLALANMVATQRSSEQGATILRAYIAKDPDNMDLRLGLGALLERTGESKAALAVYEEIIKREPSGPKNLMARNRVAAYEAWRGNLPGAEKLLAEILKENPRDLDALGLRANVAAQRGNPGAAIVDLRAVLRDVPDSAQTYRMLGRAHLANGEPALAEEALRKALDYAPTDSMARIELAQLLTRTGRPDAAVSMLEDAVRRAPNDAAAREALVRCYVEMHDLAQARTSAEDLKVLLPKSPIGSYLAGQIAQAGNRPADAEREYAQALEIDPAAMDVLAALSRLQVSLGRGEEAIARVDARVQKDGTNAMTRNLLGELLLATKQFQPAIPQFDQAIVLAPKWWLPYRNLAIAKYSLKDAAGAIRAYQAGLEKIPAEILLAVDLAALYELQHRVDDAIRVYEDFHQREPGIELATNNLAKLLLTYRTDPQSLARAIDLTAPFANSNDPSLLDTYGWAQYRKGEHAKAMASLERAFERAPDSGSIRYHLALAQAQAGQLEKAIENLEIAVASPRAFVGLAEARTLLVDLKGRSS